MEKRFLFLIIKLALGTRDFVLNYQISNQITGNTDVPELRNEEGKNHSSLTQDQFRTLNGLEEGLKLFDTPTLSNLGPAIHIH